MNKTFSMAALAVLAGCSYKKYTPKRLTPLTRECATYNQQKHDVVVRAKRFTKDDSKNFFYGTDIISPCKHTKLGIQPVHVLIENNRFAPITAVIYAKNGSLLALNQVADALHLSSDAIIFTGLGTTVLSVPCFAVGTWATLMMLAFSQGVGLGILWMVPVAFFAAGAGIIVGLSSIPACYRAQVNKLIDEQLALNEFPRRTEIAPGALVHGLVYYKSIMNTELEIAIFEGSELIAQFPIQ